MDELEIVRAAYAAWNSGDLTPALNHLHPDVEWHPSEVFPGLEPFYSGHEGVLRWREDLVAPFESFVVTIKDIRLEGDVVIARVHFDAVGAASGARVQLDYVNEWHFRDGLVVRWRATPLR